MNSAVDRDHSCVQTRRFARPVRPKGGTDRGPISRPSDRNVHKQKNCLWYTRAKWMNHICGNVYVLIFSKEAAQVDSISLRPHLSFVIARVSLSRPLYIVVIFRDRRTAAESALVVIIYSSRCIGPNSCPLRSWNFSCISPLVVFCRSECQMH